MFVKITVKTARGEVSSYLPTRDKDGSALDQALVSRLASSAVETLIWLALGYPERDMLEMGDPWRSPKQEALSEDPPGCLADTPATPRPGRVVCRCGADALGVSAGKWLCSRTRLPIDECDADIPF
jgi:hypothetical protein